MGYRCGHEIERARAGFLAPCFDYSGAGSGGRERAKRTARRSQREKRAPHHRARLAAGEADCALFFRRLVRAVPRFTPNLVKFYNEMKPKHPDFEIVYMSEDHSEAEMRKYITEMSMPWPALRYSYAKSSRLNKYAGTGIPCLVVLNDKGEVLSDSYEGKTYVGPYQAMQALGELLAKGPSALPSNATAAKTSQSAVKSPSGTNWEEAFKKRP